MKILLGTGNLDKLKELKAIFNSYHLNDVELLSLKDVEKEKGYFKEPVEDGDTFLANAYIKTMYYYEKYQMPVLCEDTGLLVKALNNAPGVHTARYGSLNGEKTDPVKNCQRILKKLQDVKDRSATFRTAMMYYDGKCLVTSVGEMNGEIGFEYLKGNGFGYDPIFYLPKYQNVVAMLDPSVKNQISHRFHATNLMVKQLINYKIIK